MLAPDTAGNLLALSLAFAEDVIDELLALPEPLETIADHGVHMLLADLVTSLRRDPVKMRKRADRAESRGNLERAEKIRERANEVEQRQAGQ